MTKQEITEELEAIRLGLCAAHSWFLWSPANQRLYQLRQAIEFDITADYIANEAANEEEGTLPGRL